MAALDRDISRSAPSDESRWAEARAELVRSVSRHTGIDDPRVLGALGRVPRHLFVPSEQRGRAYEDCALPIGQGQTISQPSMVAIMLEALHVEPNDRVLEVGAGSGYAAALLAELAREVYAVEIVPALAATARQRLADLRLDKARVLSGNGREGLRGFSPFDKILVSAGSSDVPPELVRELAPGGRMAIPVGNDAAQELLVGLKDERGEMRWERSIACIFVPLVGQA